MSDMKCPFCQQELKDQWVGQNVAHQYFDCPKCKMNGNPKLWQELIRTRKVLMDTIKLAEEMLESIEDEGMCSSYYEDRLNEIKSTTKGGDNE